MQPWVHLYGILQLLAKFLEPNLYRDASGQTRESMCLQYFSRHLRCSFRCGERNWSTSESYSHGNFSLGLTTAGLAKFMLRIPSSSSPLSMPYGHCFLQWEPDWRSSSGIPISVTACETASKHPIITFIYFYY